MELYFRRAKWNGDFRRAQWQGDFRKAQWNGGFRKVQWNGDFKRAQWNGDYWRAQWKTNRNMFVIEWLLSCTILSELAFLHKIHFISDN